MLLFQVTLSKQDNGTLDVLAQCGFNKAEAARFTELVSQLKFGPDGAGKLASLLHSIRADLPAGKKLSPSDIIYKFDSLLQTQDISSEIKKDAAFMLLYPSVNVELAVKVASSLANSDYKFSVLISDNNFSMTIGELGERILANMGADFSGQSALDVLKSSPIFHGKSDNDIFEFFKSKNPDISRKKFMALVQTDFKNVVAATHGFIGAFIEGAIRSQNSDNTGKEIYQIGLQTTTQDIAVNMVGLFLAEMSVSSQMGGQTEFTSFGSVEKNIKFDIGRDHVCYELMNSISSGLCLSFDANWQLYNDASLDQVFLKMMSQSGENSAIRATALFGQDTMAAIQAAISRAIDIFLASKESGAPLSSILVDQLQKIDVINTLRTNSEFVLKVSRKERKKKERQDENIRGGFT